MAVDFIVEDGSGLATATAYVTEAYFKQYNTNLPNRDISSLSDQQIQQYVNLATQLIDDNYRGDFTGTRQYDEQMLEWPRAFAYYVDNQLIDENVVPIEVKKATCEMAWTIYQGTDPTPVLDGGNSNLLEYSVQVDVIKESKKYTSSGGGTVIPIIPAVNNALSRITGGGSSRYRLHPYRV